MPTETRLDRRPAPDQRCFASAAVDAAIAAVGDRIADPELAWLFANCLPNTLDTTVRHDASGPDTFVITGDIDAMWLRDSSAQVWPYLRFVADDAPLRTLVHGLIRRQAACIRLDPYANAFNPEASGAGHADDRTEMRPEVFERKWEIDSLCYPMRLAHGYWQASGEVAPFDAEWLAAMDLAVATLRQQQRRDGPGPYRFERMSTFPSESLANRGLGQPARPCGLIVSSFRPSDDACILPYLVPSNAFAVAALRQLAELFTALGEADRAAAATAFAAEVDAAIHAHAVLPRDPAGAPILAYEVDGFGGRVFMDDANVPSLLALPYLGWCAADDPLYRATRAFLLSADNPWHFAGSVISGIGGPHVGPRMVWPMAVILRALTSDDDDEIRDCLRMLVRSHDGTGFMHETVDCDDAAHYTRHWFAWANTLFGELVLELAEHRPALLGETYA